VIRAIERGVNITCVSVVRAFKLIADFVYKECFFERFELRNKCERQRSIFGLLLGFLLGFWLGFLLGFWFGFLLVKVFDVKRVGDINLTRLILKTFLGALALYSISEVLGLEPLQKLFIKLS
jgi:hypothetical protein